MPEPSTILEGFLYLGSGISAQNQRLLIDYGITAILNVTAEKYGVQNAFPDKFEYLRIPVEDNSTDKIIDYFEQASEFIEKIKIQNGKILVHCVAGMSRSPSVVLAYLMKFHKMTLKDAWLHVRNARKMARPNVYFWIQLIEYEKRIKDGNTTVNIINFNGIITLPDLEEYTSSILLQ